MAVRSSWRTGAGALHQFAGLASGREQQLRANGRGRRAVGGPANSGGLGSIVGLSLETSNVDIAKEFTDLLTYQRGFQANSRVITTADELNQEALNLKR
ncbi:MAG: flagellar basal body rod C-terminal domain-containing protein [Bryobacterales bacterium]